MKIKQKHNLFLSIILCTVLAVCMMPMYSMADEPAVFASPTQFENVELNGYSRTVKLNWGAVNGVSGYELYCSNSRDNQSVLLADLSLPASTSFTYSYTDPTLQYTFTLKSYIIFNGDKYYSDAAAYNIMPYTVAETNFLSAYKVQSAFPLTGADSDYIDYIFWDFLPGVSGYEVYCEARGVEGLVTTMESPNAGFFSRPGGLLASMYRVRPYYRINGSVVYGPFTAQHLVKIIQQNNTIMYDNLSN